MPNYISTDPTAGDPQAISPNPYLSTDPTAGESPYLSTDPTAGAPLPEQTDTRPWYTRMLQARSPEFLQPAEQAIKDSPITKFITKPDKFSYASAEPVAQLEKLGQKVASTIGLEAPPVAPERPPSGIAERVAASLTQAPVDAANYMATPKGVATVAGFESGVPLVRLALQLGFSADSIKNFVEAGTLEEKVKAAAMVAAMGHATVGEARGMIETPRPTVPELKPGEVPFLPGEDVAAAKRATGEQLSPERLQAIVDSLRKQDTGLPTSPIESQSPSTIVESATDKAMRRTTPNPLRSAADIAMQENQPTPLSDAEIADHIKQKGGITLDSSGKHVTDGFSFAPNDYATTIPADKFSEQDVAAFKEAHADDLSQPGNHLGAWHDKQGNVVLDVSQVGDTLDAALVKAREANQKAVYDLRSRREISVAEGDRGDVRPNDNVARGNTENAVQTEAGGEQSGLRPTGVSGDQSAGQPGSESLAQSGTLSEARQTAEREFGQSWKLYQEKLKSNPNYARNIVDRLSKGAPKALNDVEHAALQDQVLQAESEFDDAVKGVNDNPGDTEAQHALAIARDRMAKTYNAYNAAGTGTARGLSIRQQLAARTWSLGQMESRARAELGGNPLTAEQATKIGDIHSRIVNAEKTLEANAGINLTEDELKKLGRIAGPALTDESGKVIASGKIGQTHADLMHEAMQKGGDIETVLGAFTNDAQHVFVTDRGDVLNRQQAHDVAVANKQAQPSTNGALQSQQLIRAVDTNGNSALSGIGGPEDAKKLARSIGLIKRDTADLQARTQARDTSPRRVSNPLMSDEKARALYEREKAKADYTAMIKEEQDAQKPAIVRGAKQVVQYPRNVATYGHGIVFPITHAGDLILRPTSWNTFRKGFLRTYAAAASPEFHAIMMGRLEGDVMTPLAKLGGLDIGFGHSGAGFLKGEGVSGRSWDALKVMRFELWKKEMNKNLRKNPNISYEEKIDLSKHLAEWANHATGSGKGFIADSKVGQVLAFGPKLTQSKINKLTSDPAKTVVTVAKAVTGYKTTIGERAAAKARISGATQYALTLAGFLAANQAILTALGSKQKINMTDPNQSDFWAFKIAGTDVAIPGMHTELRYLARLLGVATASRRELKGESRQSAAGSLGMNYLRGKVAPAPQLALDAAMRQDYRGRPLPFSREQGTEKMPKYSPAEYAMSKAPIPLTNPSQYVFNQMRDRGLSPVDAAETVQALTIFGLGLTGMHVGEDYSLNPKEKPSKRH